ncbi:MAG: asparagine synthetase B family protein [Gemmatimonadetes bacterium]|nr:asparagine synthetase B family protein [Gemmatimonadota bacterium]MBI3566721.1 asparagine synthetase B family protein [Gemmatimonadota bacterium]
MHTYVGELVDLTDPFLTRLDDLTLDEARSRVLAGDADAVRAIGGSFAIVARDGETVRIARSLDRPVRYFLAKKVAGPALIVADRIDAIHDWLKANGFGDQFHPNYTRMVPAHYITTIRIVGCPDPSPSYRRFVVPRPGTLPNDVDAIGRAYVGALSNEIATWLRRIPADAPVGVSFSGGIDSGSVVLVAAHVMRTMGLDLGRLKAFTLDAGDGPDLAQARTFLDAVDMGLFLEPIEVDGAALDVDAVIRITEDYKALDVECAAMGLALLRGIRARYPDWRYLMDGDGGDENMKDYPIEENPELTIRSVVNNPLLYQEGWGVDTMKHSLTYSGGLSRSYVRTYAPARHLGFEGFSPYTRPALVELAGSLPWDALTGYDVDRLYALKGEIVARGVHALTGVEMPVFDKRRFQHGAIEAGAMRRAMPWSEADYRRRFLARYA